MSRAEVDHSVDSRSPISAALVWGGVHLLALLLLVGAFVGAAHQGELGNIDFHRSLHASVSALLAMITTFVVVARVGVDYEHDQFVARGPYPHWLGRHLVGLGLRLGGLCLLPLLAIVAIVVAGMAPPLSLLSVVTANGGGLLLCAMLGVFARLLLREGLVAGLVALAVLLVISLLPMVCCLPFFNPPVATFFSLSPAAGASRGGAGASAGILLAVGIALVPQLLLTAGLAGLGWWRYVALQAKKTEADERKRYLPCRHCGERFPPETEGPCPACAEDDPFGG